MTITASEFKKRLGRYLLLSATEDIFITRNGIIIAKLTNPSKDRVDLVESLVGVIDSEVAEEEAREERLSRL